MPVLPPTPQNTSPVVNKPKPPWVVVPPKLSESKTIATPNPVSGKVPDPIPTPKPSSPPPPPGKPSVPERPLTPEGPPVPERPPAPEGPPASGKPPTSLIKESPFKKIIPVVLGLLVAVVLFLLIKNVILPLFRGGESAEEEVKEPVTLTYWGLWEEEAIMETVINNYQTENPHITINYTYQSAKDYRERLQSAFARQEGPDIFRFHNTWQPMLKKELASIPGNIFSQTEFQNTFYPVAFDDLSSQGQIYGIPIMFDSLALFYNPALFEAAGQEVPETWDELRQTAKDLTVYDVQGKIQTAGVALGTTENVEHFSDIVGLMILQSGADPAEPSDPLVQDALTFYTLFNTKDRVWDETLPNSIYAFATGKVAMIFAPSWQIFSIMDINPSFEFRTAEIPQLPGGEVAWATYWAEGVSAQSINQEEAFAFLKYLSSSVAMTEFYNETTKIRLFGEPYSRKDLALQLEDDDLVGAFVKQGPYAKSWYLASRTHDNGLNDRIIKYYQDAVNSLIEGHSGSGVFETLESGVFQVLSQYGL